MTREPEPAAGDVWLCAPGFEATLQAELGPGARPLAGVPGAVAHDQGPASLDPTFARQLLPRAARVAGESVGELAQAAFDLLAAPLDAPAGGPATSAGSLWALHVFAVEAEPDDAPRGRARYAPRAEDRREERDPLVGRARLVEAALLERFDRFRKRTLRRRVEGAALAPGGSLAQVALVGREAALVSVGKVSGVWPEPRWPGGAVPVADDPQAPSSAYRKVEEAYLVLGAAPGKGERVVDLGGAPGGWSWTALRRGARVLLVDRAPPEPPVLGHPQLEARIGDALAYEPAEPPNGPAIDWLLCDVATTPARTLELLERWLSAGWCRHFVVQTKLKGDDDRLASARALRELLAKHSGGVLRVRHLTHDKNEVTAIGTTRGAGP